MVLLKMADMMNFSCNRHIVATNILMARPPPVFVQIPAINKLFFIKNKITKKQKDE